MAKWDQQHRDALTLEERRIKGGKLLNQGVSQAEVARSLAVSPVSVHEWAVALQSGGIPALKAKRRVGRSPFVSEETMSTLPDILARGAQFYGFSTDLWTIPRIARVLETEWQVHYSKSAVWLILKAHNLSWQKPRRQAREKNLRKTENWKRHSWPRLKKKPSAEEQ